MRRFTWTIAPIIMIAVIVSTMSWTERPVDAAPGNQPLCPVMGFEINRELFTDYKSKRIYFCCPACPPEFKKTPEKFMAKMNAEGIIPEDAPTNAS